ncbi:MAG TPA: hypothetical protein P5163_11435 [Rubrivivax sp.]|nr:hypothetical protein [Rubrivivax sp.]HRY88453.1 hypothetical protein [Rubrivivax sp.]HRZ61198.1 hypothetical protein [Rubrivivax sp.]
MSPAARNRTQLAVIAVLLLALAALAYKFIVAGSVVPGDDGRQAVVLEPGERAFVLREMRGFVAGVQQLTDALARDDLKAAAAAARTMGMAAAHDAPPALIGKLPLEFKTLAFATHRGFDALAADAHSLGDPKHTLAQLAGVLHQCVECHDAYQFVTPAGR